jgi:hypothetical protein
MGYGSFDYSSSATRAAARAASGTSAFGHSAKARAGLAPKLHPALDLRRKPLREARDTAESPESLPIAILCDVTGSMGEIPGLVINQLNKLAKMVIADGVVQYPQFAFGAIGDAYSDQVPVALGEFEADDELAEAHLSNIFIEGGGGGGGQESYELPLWFFGNRVETDAWDKRRRKGLLFLIGDEAPYPHVSKRQAEEHLGVGPDEDVPLLTAARQAQQKFDVFLIRPGGSYHFDDDAVETAWKSVLPAERVIRAADWAEIVPKIAATIAVMGGKSLADTIASLKASGFDAKLADAAGKALVPLAGSIVPTVGGSTSALVSGPAGSPRAKRL